MFKRLFLVALVCAQCLATSSCIPGDVWYEFKVTNDCDSALEVTFDRREFYQQNPDVEPLSAAIVPSGSTGSIGMLSSHILDVIVRQPGGAWLAVAEVSTSELREGGPVVVAGEACPSAPVDRHQLGDYATKYSFLAGAQSAALFEFLEPEDDTPLTEGTVKAMVVIVVSGDEQWFGGFVAAADDWENAEMPALPADVEQSVPQGLWERSRSVGVDLKAEGAAPLQVFVNREALAVVLRFEQ